MVDVIKQFDKEFEIAFDLEDCSDEVLLKTYKATNIQFDLFQNIFNMAMTEKYGKLELFNLEVGDDNKSHVKLNPKDDTNELVENYMAKMTEEERIKYKLLNNIK